MISDLADTLRQEFLSQFSRHNVTCRLFLSASDMKTRALTRHASAGTPEEAWDRAMDALSSALSAANISPTILRADWVIATEESTWANLVKEIESTRRNYFRKGIALDLEWRLALTEMELNANAMLYQSGNISKGRINEKNWTAYCRKRFGCDFPKLSPESPVVLFTTEGAFLDTESGPFGIHGQGLHAGHRDIPKHSPELFLDCAEKAACYLTRQCQPSGRFNYGSFSCFDVTIPTYNTLRHISTTWSMVEAYKAFHHKELKAAIDRSLFYAIKTFLRIKGNEAYFEDVEEHALKLGSNGCALILLTRYVNKHNQKKFLPLMRALANGILAMQENDGSFVHVLNNDFSLKEKTRIVYYDGEALFGLLRLYGLTKDHQLLAASERAFAWCIANDHWKNHDHWLSYAVNEITRYLPEEKYFTFGINNFKEHLTFIAERDTAYPTLLELMLAADEMLRRLKKLPNLQHLLENVDLSQFASAMKKRATNLFNGFFWPELAMFFKRPEKIVHSFFIKHHAFRVRIDDVQHYLSSFIGYARWLDLPPLSFQRYYRTDFPETALRSIPDKCWCPAELASAADGTWNTQPPDGWFANSLISNPGYLSYVPQPVVFVTGNSRHHAVHLRIREKHVWDNTALLKSQWSHFAGAIVEEPLDLPSSFPQLVVKDSYKALIEVGIAARKRFKGKVIGVTGSVGKTTTCEMLHQVLAQDGSVFTTYASHNNKLGVASVFASIKAETDYAVLEIAVPACNMLGGSVSTYIPPHVACVTEIGEAHLTLWNDVETLARMKSRIFEGMSPKSYAILNRDMPFFSIFEEKAQALDLTLLTFGTDPSSDLHVDAVDSLGMQFSVHGKSYRVPLSQPSKHRAMNTCAVAGVLLALNLDIEEHLPALSSFQALSGRGEVFLCERQGCELTVMDESFNASPASMRAAIEAMSLQKKGSIVLVLGDMLELGENSQALHESLEDCILKLAPSRVLLCGKEMAALWNKLSKHVQGRLFADIDELCKGIDPWLRSGDHVLIKGSHGTGLWQLVEKLTENRLSERE